MVHIFGLTMGGDQLALVKISFSVACCIIIYLLSRPYLSAGLTLQPVYLILLSLTLLLVLSLLLELSSAATIMPAATPGPPCFLGLPLAMVAPRLVHDIL